jgi:hypothetical protein
MLFFKFLNKGCVTQNCPVCSPDAALILNMIYVFQEATAMSSYVLRESVRGLANMENNMTCRAAVVFVCAMLGN